MVIIYVKANTSYRLHLDEIGRKKIRCRQQNGFDNLLFNCAKGEYISVLPICISIIAIGLHKKNVKNEELKQNRKRIGNMESHP